MATSYSTKTRPTTNDNIFSQCQQELVAFVSQCVMLRKSMEGDANVKEPTFGMNGLLDETKYTFVSRIHQKIQDTLGPLLDQQLKECAEPVIPLLIDKILSSSQYTQLVNQIANDAMESTAEILDHLPKKNSSNHSQSNSISNSNSNSNSHNGNQNIKFTNCDEQRHDASFSAHSTNTLESWSLGSLSSGVCPGTDDLQTIAVQLQPSHSFPIRLTGAQLLASFSVADLLADEFWPLSKVAIQLALLDSDTQIATIGLKVYARAFKLAPPYMVPEVYISYTHQLCQSFMNGPNLKLGLGLDIRDPRVELRIKQFRLLNQFMIHLPSIWFRFSEQIFKDVMNATAKILKCSLNNGSTTSITALHFLSIVDPNSSWYEKWMISHLGRTQIILALSQSNIIPILADCFIKYSISITKSIQVDETKRDLHLKTDELLVEDVDQNEDGDNTNLINSSDLEYLHFLHITIILSKLTMCSAGRKCFPIKLTETKHFKNILTYFDEVESDSLNLEIFILILIRDITSKAKLLADNNVPELECFRMPRVVSRMIRDLAAADVPCREELFKDTYLSQLLIPVENAIDTNNIGADEQVSLLAIAEALSHIASTDSGRKLILRGEINYRTPQYNSNEALLNNNKNKTLDTIANFVKSNCSNIKQTCFSKKILESYIYFLRQFYRTCEGLLWLSKYQLHISLSHALKQLQDDSKESNQSHQDLDWNISLIDNLLNFGATPKGVMLLYDSGSMEPCVSYMFSSKCEKFGYGTLVSQISTTKPGMQALCKTGWIQYIINDLWKHLECDVKFDETYIDIDDPSIGKIIANVMKLFTTFHGLSSCLEYESHHSNDKGSLTHLIESLIIIEMNRESSLITFEDSHQAGLRIFKHISSCLDSCILLQSRFSFQQSLVREINDSYIFLNTEQPNQEVFITDENSLLCNHILLSTMTMGGPTERKLPPLNLISKNMNQYIFNRYQLPKFIYEDFNPKRNLGNTIQNFDALINTCLDITELQSIFIKQLEQNDIIPVKMVQTIILKFFELLLDNKTCNGLEDMGWLTIKKHSKKNPKISEGVQKCQKLGIIMASRYILLLLPHLNAQEIEKSLEKVLNYCHSMVYSCQEDTIETFSGFDWFSSTVYAIFEGQMTIVLDVLNKFSNYLPSLYVWSQFGSHHFNWIHRGFNNSPTFAHLCHWVEAIAELELPKLISAFTLCGCTPTQMVQKWFRELFWNILDFHEIQSFLLICMLFGIDYQIYYCIAIMNHIQNVILPATRDEKLIYVIHDAQLGKGFSTVKYLPYMHKLRDRHRNMVLPDLKRIESQI
ncbi:broad-minded protein-domain-containing protein [Globomyces pollinis-pini]|nr:broad-minded protein-domain-containing protein [Globomyces pollinis-pini]